MGEGWSRGHRQEWDAIERSWQVQADIIRVGLTEEAYDQLKGSENFLLILGIALQENMSWYAAECAFYDRRREERNAALREQYQQCWQGDGTGVYEYNKDPSFDDDQLLNWYLQQTDVDPDGL